MCFATMVVPVCVGLCVSWSCGARSHWNGCMMLHGLCVGEEAGARNLAFFRVKWLQPAMNVAWCCGCLRNTIVFCSWRLRIVLAWLHPGCDSDLSADFRTFGAINFPLKNPCKKCFKMVFFLLWRRNPVLELLLPTLLRVVLLCFATQSLQIAL